MIKKSFALRVLAASFLFLALPLLVDSFIFFQHSYYDAIVDAKKMLEAEANYRILNLSTLQSVRRVLLRELIYILDLSKGLDHQDSEKLNQTLTQAVQEGGKKFELYILKMESSTRYKIIASSVAESVNTYFVSYIYLPEALKLEEETFIRYDYSNPAEKTKASVFTAKVIHSDKTKQPIGIIMASADIENQLATLVAQSNIHENMRFAILNPDTIAFAATDPQLRGNFFTPMTAERRKEIIATRQIAAPLLAKQPMPVIKRERSPFFEFIFHDQVQIAYQSDSLIEGGSLLSYSPKEIFFASAVGHFLLIYTIYGLILVIGGGVAYWLSLWLSRPLRQLSYLMLQVSKGKLDARFKEEPFGFEINLLGKLFNQTLDNLLENIQRAEDERVKMETYRRELSIIRQVQRSLLPHDVPHIKGAEFAGIYLPAIDVGGDYYGYLVKKAKSGEEVVIISVADAPGRGISPCLYALSARGMFRTYATLSDDVGEILSAANNDFIQDAGDSGVFIRIFYGMYHVDSKIFSYYSCGHLPGFVRKADGKIVPLTRSGIAIGLKRAEASYLPDSIQLEAGDCLVLHTDGLIQAVNEKKERFSESHIKNFVQKRSWPTAQNLVDGLTSHLQEFTHSLPQEEEIIIVALKIKEEG